jgi:hypothetical protein
VIRRGRPKANLSRDEAAQPVLDAARVGGHAEALVELQGPVQVRGALGGVAVRYDGVLYGTVSGSEALDGGSQDDPYWITYSTSSCDADGVDVRNSSNGGQTGGSVTIAWLRIFTWPGPRGGSLREARHEVDGRGDDHGAQREREPGVP